MQTLTINKPGRSMSFPTANSNLTYQSHQWVCYALAQWFSVVPPIMFFARVGAGASFALRSHLEIDNRRCCVFENATSISKIASRSRTHRTLAACTDAYRTVAVCVHRHRTCSPPLLVLVAVAKK